jgi:hypothetical protein
MRRNLLFYFAVPAVFGLGIYLTLDFGARLRPAEALPRQQAESARAGDTRRQSPEREASHDAVAQSSSEKLREPLSMLLLQVIVIIIAARVFGALFVRMGQPALIGEIVAGVILGPSLLGMLFPAGQAFLFPASSMDFLRLLSQLGVILFMFVVGMDLNVQHLRRQAHAAVLVSHASIVVPFFLGVTFSLLI